MIKSYKFLHNFAVSHLEIKCVAWSIDRFRVWSIATRLMVSHLHDTLWYDLIESIDTKRNSVYIYIIDVFDVIPHFHLRNEARQWIMQVFILPDRFAFIESFCASIYYLHIMINCGNIDSWQLIKFVTESWNFITCDFGKIREYLF